MLDIMMPIDGNTVHHITAQLLITRQELAEKESQLRDIMQKKRCLAEKMKLNADVAALREKEKELAKELEYALAYITKSGPDYCKEPYEDVREYIQCIAHVYGKAVYADDDGSLYVLQLDAEDGYMPDVGAMCDDHDALIPLSSLPQSEQTLIKRYLTQRYGKLRWTEHNTMQAAPTGVRR